MFKFLTFDFSDIVNIIVNKEKIVVGSSETGHVAETQFSTRLADHIRIGKAFVPTETRFAAARVSCVQLYDVPMSFAEMEELSTKCEKLEMELNGVTDNLVLMLPLNQQSGCYSTVPINRKHHLNTSRCIFSDYGPRRKPYEAVTMNLTEADHVTIKSLKEDVTSLVLDTNSSFTLMFYIKLDTENKVDARLGFIQSDGMITQTWVLLSTNGTLIFNSGETSSTEVDKAYNQTEVEWIHLAISCDSPSGRCHIFRNCSLIGELFGREWFVSSQLYVDGIPANNAVAATIELSCLQLYSRGLSHGEIISSKDRCTFRGGYRVY